MTSSRFGRLDLVAEVRLLRTELRAVRRERDDLTATIERVRVMMTERTYDVMFEECAARAGVLVDDLRAALKGGER